MLDLNEESMEITSKIFLCDAEITSLSSSFEKEDLILMNTKSSLTSELISFIQVNRSKVENSITLSKLNLETLSKFFLSFKCKSMTDSDTCMVVQDTISKLDSILMNSKLYNPFSMFR